MADAQKYTSGEALCRVLNAGEDALKVDIDNVTLITEGSDINIEVHTDKAEDSMLIFSHTVASGSGGTSLVPLVDSAGHLQVDVLTTPSTDSIYVDDADWSDGSSKHTLVGGLYQSSPQSITDGDVGPFQVDVNGRLGVALSPTDNAVLDAMVVDLAAMEVLLTGIDADTDAIKTDAAAIEVLLTAANVDHAANEVLLTGIDADTNAIKVDMAAIEVLLTAANVDHAANEVLLGTIDADTDAIKTATESSASHLGNMFYDTALAVTPSDGSDLTGEPFFAVYVGTGGNLKVDMADGGSAVTLSNVASGQLLPIMVERIYATGTTASNIIAFK
tara:strand:+ start:110 stop:1105 length:996 start_codon:yes stop_codon:yes gene_type:complete